MQPPPLHSSIFHLPTRPPILAQDLLDIWQEMAKITISLF